MFGGHASYLCQVIQAEFHPPLSDVEEDEVQHIVIKTSYNPLSPENQRFKAPWNKADNSIWSATERSHAEAGEQLRSIEGLKMKLAKLYHNGVKITQDAYLRIPMHIIPNHHLELRNADGSLMVFVSTTLLAHIRSTLEMETYLQEEFELLMEVMAVLPGNCSPPIAPFISLVININMCTKAHRDSQDRHWSF
ncbi:hypothetical protein DFH29DRAFT_1005040 [Suillus ampliporus]|nr:hypothetical protein DFH29DRAFT_1005040 [Suillus ampliporus]